MARIWMPDYPPTSASSYDDEFADASFDTGVWTEWDPGSKLTVSEGAHGLDFLHAANNGDMCAGVYRAVPSETNWAIWTKVSLLAPGVNYHDAGLLLGEDLSGNPNTSDIYQFNLRFAGSGAFYISLFRWNAYNSWNGSLINSTDAFAPTHMYLRIRKSSTNYSFDWSTDGLSWQQYYSNTLAFAPAQMGLMSQNSDTGNAQRAVFAFFRATTATPSLTDIMSGKRVM